MRECPVAACFFFQAEDGIRELYVTGVQTCALPISRCRSTSSEAAMKVSPATIRPRMKPPSEKRSEERRVGKECRPRWSPSQSKQNRRESADRQVRPAQHTRILH